MKRNNLFKKYIKTTAKEKSEDYCSTVKSDDDQAAYIKGFTDAADMVYATYVEPIQSAKDLISQDELVKKVIERYSKADSFPKNSAELIMNLIEDIQSTTAQDAFPISEIIAARDDCYANGCVTKAEALNNLIN